MKVVVIIQARMSSTRLPGKVLLDVAGQPLLALQIDRLARCAVDEILVATTTDPLDDAIVELARHMGVRWFRGSKTDVLARFVGAAEQARADVVVRVTGDCPLVDPEVTDRVVSELKGHSSECDYASNVLKRTYPRGLDVEAFFADVLLRMDRLGRSAAAREHVTLGPRSEHPHLFLRRSVEDTEDNSDLRWTVDTPADLRVVRALAEGLGLSRFVASYTEMLAYARSHPELTSLNRREQTWEPVR